MPVRPKVGVVATVATGATVVTGTTGAAGMSPSKAVGGSEMVSEGILIVTVIGVTPVVAGIIGVKTGKAAVTTGSVGVVETGSAGVVATGSVGVAAGRRVKIPPPGVGVPNPAPSGVAVKSNDAVLGAVKTGDKGA